MFEVVVEVRAHKCQHVPLLPWRDNTGGFPSCCYTVPTVFLPMAGDGRVFKSAFYDRVKEMRWYQTNYGFAGKG